MSAPLVVNTKDGTCWTRRTVTSGGIALYAPVSVKTCPDFVMATLPELAEHGIVGSAFALPMPVAPEPKPRTILDRARDALTARMAKDDLRLVLENVIGYAAWLEAERHSTNEALSEAAETLRANRDRITELEAQRERRRLRLVALQNDALSMRGSLSPADGDRKVPFELGETLTPAVDWLIARVAELEAAPTTLYRAEHPDAGITLGHYGTEAAARAHCEATERRSWPTGSHLTFGWIRDALPEDDENGVAELVVTAGQNEESTTGYVVTALELDSEYDPDGDE